MDILRPPPSGILVSKVADWLMQVSLDKTDLESVVSGCCERLSAAGIPLARVQCSFSMLHPLYVAMGFTWRRGKGIEVEGYRHNSDDDEGERFKRSPYFHLMSNELDHLRCRLDDGTAYSEFPLFDDLRAEGITDYLAFASAFTRGTGKGMIGSWSTDRTGGFSDEEIGALLRIQNRLAVACKVAVQDKLGRSMLSTYLGNDAGSRVLEGQIKRGDGETVRAAIVMADLRNSTELAESVGRQAYIDALNTFFDAVASPFADAGGEILSFVGDGFLAAFPCGRNRADSKRSCAAAVEAAQNAIANMAEANRLLTAQGQSPLGFGIGLHIGNVTFGNVGLMDRLTFSVFGATVNEASRLEALTKQFKSPVIASQNFVDYCDGKWQSLGAESLRGVEAAMEVYKLHDAKPRSRVVDFMSRKRQTTYSDAERVVMLHRDSAS